MREIQLQVKGSSGTPALRGCNMVTPDVPTVETSPPENTLALTIPMVLLWTTSPQPSAGLLPEQQQAYQEEQQA
jgi:hypothetical protein